MCAQILGWEDDPGAPGSPNQPIPRPVPDLAKAPLATEITTPAPAAQQFPQNTPEFRYWAAADALRRASDYWGGIVGNLAWHATVGPRLRVILDAGTTLNAFYDRNGLSFFHGRVNPQGPDVFSANSPDVVCHEFGHALLDAVRPQLWGATNPEVPAFHESFGDMSALLTELQLKSVRDNVLATTFGVLDRNSRLSRMAEQLGWAIRQFYPDAVDAVSLRNACNSFFFSDPVSLPPRAPATSLSSESHSFSRVFTAGFLSGLAGWFGAGPRTEQALQQASVELGRLLIDAVRATPVVVGYFSQVATHMVAIALQRHGETEAVRGLFFGLVGHGLISLPHASETVPAAAAVGGLEELTSDVELSRMVIGGGRFGLAQDLVVHVGSEAKRFAVAAAAPDLGAVPGTSHDRAATAYVEDLFRRGSVLIDADVQTGREIVRDHGTRSHEIRREGDQLVLERRLFDCGFSCAE